MRSWITLDDVFNGTAVFIAKTDAEDVTVVMVSVREIEFLRRGVVSEGRQFRGVIRTESQASISASIGEKFELITSGNDEICIRKMIFLKKGNRKIKDPVDLVIICVVGKLSVENKSYYYYKTAKVYQTRLLIPE
jgi:hypothetical protein